MLVTWDKTAVLNSEKNVPPTYTVIVISEKSLSIIFNSLNVFLDSHTFHAKGGILSQETEMHEVGRYKTMDNGGALHMGQNK